MCTRRIGQLGLLLALLWLAFMGVDELFAQAVQPHGSPFDQAVTSLVAEKWGVEEDRVILDWGSAPIHDIPDAFSGVDLIGSGRHGHLVVSFKAGDPGDRGFQILVRAGVRILEPVASRSLDRGATLEFGDVHLEPTVHWGEPVSKGPKVELGWVAQRTIRSGEPLARPAVAPPKVVESGKPVQILWKRGGVAVTLAGKASGTAELGQRVYVRTENGQRLLGIARGPGRVEILNVSSEEIR